MRTSNRIWLFCSLVAFTAAIMPANSLASVCDRTPKIRDEIVNWVNHFGYTSKTCAEVSDTDLDSVTHIFA
jgi:hypothetical protein